MRIIGQKTRKKLELLLVANQVIMNSYPNLDGFEQIQAFGQFCDNTAEALFIVGGVPALEYAKEVAFLKDQK